MQKTPTIAWVYLVTLSLIWGSSFILIKKGLVGLEAEEVGALRIVSASLFLLPITFTRIKRINGTTKWLSVLSVGFLGSLIPAFLFAIAQTKLESAVTGVINALVPIFTVLLAWFLLKQKPTNKVFIGVFIGFIGATILISAGKDGLFSNLNAYAFLVILATICYASNLNVIKKHLNDVPPLTVTSLSLLLVGPVATIYLFGFTDFWPKLLNQESARLSTFYICLLGILGTSIALIIFNKILQMTNPIFTSSVTYIIPIIAVMWGVFDGENLFMMHYVGMIAIGVGVYIANSNRITQRKAGNTK